MNSAITVCHGGFGRLCFFELNRSIVLHTHREGQLLFLIEGDDVALNVNDSPITLTKNHAVAIDSFMPSALHEANPSSSATVLSLFINPIWFATRFNSGDPDWLSFSSQSYNIDAGIRDQLDHLTALVQPPTPDTEPGYHMALETRLRHLCSACFQDSYRAISLQASANPIKSSDIRIRRSLAIMNTHVKNNLPLDEIARAAGLSRPHFYRLFRDNLGVTPNVYMNMLRIEYAIDRLVFSDQPVTSIAHELGFASQASFTRFFGANVGIPPTDYRRVALLPPEMRASAVADAQRESNSDVEQATPQFASNRFSQ